MAIETICSGCGKRLAVSDEFAGRRARCPACGQIYTVPSVATEHFGEANSRSADRPMPDETQSYAPVPGFGPTRASSDQQSNESKSGSFWMKATNGQVYGPVDRATLDRWFAEGRIGPGYQIRNSEYSDWQLAAQFQPTSQPDNPYGDRPYQASAGVGSYRRWPKSDNSGIILALGILSWVTTCPICGIIAWVMGGQALNDMQKGLVDPTSRGMVQVGYYLGMVHVILAICCFGFYAIIIAVAALAGM